jgi:pimeloyl-ACP methyl ester carboxylesterase
MPDPASIFKTPEAEKQFMAAYEDVMALWPVPHDALDVPTRFGTTHINTAGPEDKPAMVLFPGFGANSAMWFPNIAALSAGHRVFAVDTPGQPGKSIPTRTLDTKNCTDWIDDVVDGLGLVKPFMGGISLGGWLALDFAIRRPGRASRVALIDPAASFEPMSRQFFWHSLIPFMIYPTRAGLVQYFKWMMQGYETDKRWGELMLQGILNTKPQPPLRAAAFSDAELRSIQTPVLLLIGARSIIYNPQRVYRRATQLIPRIRAQIIPDASHALLSEKSDVVNAEMVQFFQAE